MITPAQINRRNNDFWAEQTRLRDKRMRDPVLASAALDMLRDEDLREVPVRSRLTLEASLERAEKLQQATLAGASSEPNAATRRIVLADTGRKGGAARRRLDPLQDIIQRQIERDPTITQTRLLKKLHGLAGPGGIIYEIDASSVHYQLADGRLRDAPISGLKHRLYRARKRV